MTQLSQEPYAGEPNPPVTRDSVAALARNRRIDPALALRVEILRLYCFLRGYSFRITSAFRSHAEQDALYAQGRPKEPGYRPGDIVTNARGGQSKHNDQGKGYCSAVDIYCTDPSNPKRSAAEVTSEVAKVGVALGLKWGGQWVSAKAKSLGDVWHLETSPM